MKQYDVVVLGCGPAGATAAKHLCDLGYSVLGIEKEQFPRYHIGESLTGTVAQYLDKEKLNPVLEAHEFPVKYGVKVIGSEAKNEFFVATAPGPTWQVRRNDFDHILLQHAVDAGMDYRLGSAKSVTVEGDTVKGITYQDLDDNLQDIACRCVVDASGDKAFLSRQKIAGERVKEQFGDQVAIFTQIKNCERDPGLMFDNTMIFYNEEKYHWAWFIPLTRTLVSVGIVVSSETYRQRRSTAAESEKSTSETILDWGLRNINPDLWRRCGGREWVEPVKVMRDYSYDIRPFAGKGWICAGDSHRFIDPIFSFGVSIAITEGQMAANAIHQALENNEFATAFDDYQRRSDIGQNAAQDVIRYFWEFPAFFGVQAQGKYRDDIMRLFAGGCYDEPALPGLAMMRESLARKSIPPAGQVSSG